MANPDVTELVARGNAIDAILGLYFESVHGEAVGLSVDPVLWTDPKATSLTRAERARGWSDLTSARQLLYQPLILATATAELPTSGDASLPAYLELVTLIWNAEILAMHAGLDAAGRREQAMNDLADLYDGAAVRLMAAYEQQALDELIEVETGTPFTGDDAWARELGLL